MTNYRNFSASVISDASMNRERRMRVFSDFVLHTIADHVAPSSRHYIFDALMDAFMTQGVDFVSERERQELASRTAGINDIAKGLLTPLTATVWLDELAKQPDAADHKGRGSGPDGSP